ncbi:MULTISPECIES: SusC/RagA family TonB-linked outer membrane protein [unclassified Pedobacter]|uniref:SusC/RagA family TonB-linked outer membrane protein n=1 Tax=unclassified Pedobacter TaxID=2628915 RepID=UPI00141E7D2C|nr:MULTISPECIES: TonB-dependent receptor [unclassified Pedobacter]NII83054.1 TonB-linked SusC/RagA family outer membrane protein [Pedobacter sp. SG908]NMN37072.1 TonB-linked SusC/RagA family outer membrane protein [Pedobacter sp. SG918]
MKKIINHFVLLLLIAAFYQANAQAQNTISGTVSDKSGGVPGVSVYEKEFGTNGTTTDEQGRFTLKLKGTAKILIIKNVGYITREIDAKGKTSLKITIEDDVKGLEDVVVLGFGQKTKKITNTGAISSISGAEIRQSPSASLQNSLAGRLPGFFSQQRSGQPGKDGAAFQIRGISTYAGSGATSPLIIVDDIEFTLDQVNQLDPNEVESITILKDASTTAVYGVRGANGVLIIKTRRGESGKPQLTFRNETGLQMPTQRPKVNDGYTTLSLLRERVTSQYLDPAVAYPQYFSGNTLDHYRTNDDPYNYPSVNWWDEVLKKVSLQNRVNLDISGGSKIAKYFVSLGYLSQGGIYKDFSKDQGFTTNYFYNRYNFRSNVDIDPTKDLHIRLDLSGRFGITNEPYDKAWNNGGTTFQYLWNGELSSFSYPVYWPNGLIASSANPSAVKPNPVANLMYSGYTRTYGNNLNFVAQANQKLDFITPGLAANALVSFASDYGFTRTLRRSGSGTNLEILAYIYNANTKTYDPWKTDMYRMGTLVREGASLATNRLLNLQANLNYNRSFGNHNISALALLNQTTNSTDISAALAAEPYNIRGITGKVGYNYKQKYLFDFSAGYNGSDKFESSKRYQLFPAASIGWNISEEPFFKNNIKFVDAFKIRGSYGLTGNDAIGSSVYSYAKTYSTGSGRGYVFGETPTTSAGLIEPTLSNYDITWEVQQDADVGVDLKMFKGKLSLTADYFYKKRKNILSDPGTLPGSFGGSVPKYNLGIVKNTGYELDVTYRDRVNNNITFFANSNITYANNEIVFRDEPATLYPWLSTTGKPVGAQFGYTSDGFYQTLAELYNAPKLVTNIPLSNTQLGSLKFKDLNNDGIIDQNDAGYLGTNQPKYTVGLSFGFTYKNFDVSTLFQGAFDYIIRYDRGVLAYQRPDRQSIPFNLGRWTPITATDATFPEISGSANNSLVSSYWYSKGDYVRWKNFEIGYRFSSHFVKKLHLNNLRLYANGYNMGLVYTALPVFIDPESAVSASAGEYPQQRIVNFGIQVGL